MDLTQIDYAENELLYNRFMEPSLQAAINALGLPPGSVGLDVGCGPGGVLHLLDNAAGNVGRVVGIDISTSHLEMAQGEIERRNIGERVSVSYADLNYALPFPDDVFDWAWTADVLSSGPPELGVPDPIEVVKELARVVKPGGTVALFFGNWLGAMYMPGYAYIEQSLCTALELYYRKKARFHPSFHHENATQWLRSAGLTNIKVTSYTTEYQAPLKPEVAQYIQQFVFEDEYKKPNLKDFALQVGMGEADWQTWLSIANPESPDYLLAHQDYYCVRFGTLTRAITPH